MAVAAGPDKSTSRWNEENSSLRMIMGFYRAVTEGLTVEQLSEEIGIRAIVVDAKNPSAEAFYLKYGFQHLHTFGARKSLFLII